MRHQHARAMIGQPSRRMTALRHEQPFAFEDENSSQIPNVSVSA
jgi:hypothetical protein